ncbi:hypothetical protein [Nocardioides sp.]|uniref:hypothetical protein n=1 Tax=Nocardioides sp. TaxID=35761 RepID=UPI002ED31B62
MSTQRRTVLQKLLTSDLGSAIVEEGYDQVGGYVVDAGAAAGLRTPDALLAAHGFEAGGEYVDVVRFELPPLASLRRPTTEGERPWPTYPSGFLRGDSLVPVWELSRTRYPYGAEYWRIRADGEQRCLSAYQGAARGWRGASGWRAPTPLVGPRARWRGREVPADVVGDGALLTFGPADAPAEAEEIRPGVWAAGVPLADCELFETVLTASVDGVSVRVLESDGTTARVLLLSDREEDAARVGAGLAEPGVFEADVAVTRLADTSGVTNELARPS